MSRVIEDERHWRISKSGFSIKTGWAEDKRIIAKYAGLPSDREAFAQWLENAEEICNLHNAAIDRTREG